MCGMNYTIRGNMRIEEPVVVGDVQCTTSMDVPTCPVVLRGQCHA